MNPSELESLLSTSGVLAGIFLTLMTLDKLAFWALRLREAFRPRDTALVEAVQKLTEAVVELKVMAKHHEDRLTRLEDREP